MRDLVARESGCCSFFTFTVRPGPQDIGLDVEVDGAQEAVLDALQERATAIAGRDMPSTAEVCAAGRSRTRPE